MEDVLVKEIPEKDMANGNYTVLVRPYTFGQFRIQLTDLRITDDYAPSGHGAIVREMCTYKQDTMEKITSGLAQARDPEVYAESLVKPGNCEGPGGRIRLDAVDI